MDYSSDSIFSKKNIVSYLILAIIVLAIPLGIALIQRQTQLKSKATADPISFSGTGVNCTATQCTTTSATNDIQISSTLGPPP